MAFEPLTITKTPQVRTSSFVPLGQPEPPKHSFVTDWLGIKSTPQDYIKESAKQLVETIKHPIQTSRNFLNAGAEAETNVVKTFIQANKDLLKTKPSSTPFPQALSTILKAGTADASLIFLPISTMFTAAEKIPILKQAVDALSIPFNATGKLGSFSADKFIDVLPVNQSTKDTLRPAFEEVGTLTGQILLGGKVMDLLTKGKPVEKTSIDTLKEEVKTKVAETKPTSSFEPITSASSLLENKKMMRLPIPSDKIVGQGFTATSLVDKAKIELGKKLNDYRKAQDTYNKKPTPKNLGNFIKTRTLWKEALQTFETALQTPQNAPETTTSPTIGNIPKESQPLTQETIPNQTRNVSGEIPQAPITPDTTGGTPSGVAKSIEAKAIEQNLTKGYKNLAEYDPTTFKYQAEQTSKLLENPDNFRAILRGEEPKPADVNGISLIAGAEEYAKKHPELAGDLMYEAANSPYTSGVSKAAQELVLAQQRTPDSATAKLTEIKKVRAEKAGGEQKVKAKNKTVRDTVSTETKKALLSEKEAFSLDKFLNDITC